MNAKLAIWDITGKHFRSMRDELWSTYWYETMTYLARIWDGIKSKFVLRLPKETGVIEKDRCWIQDTRRITTGFNGEMC